jgi:Family of unknown function (DUF5313)
MTRPGPLRDAAASVDLSLPESMGDRVQNDLTGSTATPGCLIRSITAFLPAYAAVALVLPGSPAFRGAALVLAALLALVDSFAFIALSRHLAQRYGAEDLKSARTTALCPSPRSHDVELGRNG